MLEEGLIVAAFGKRYNVELADGRKLSCVTRGKKVDNAAGDRVSVKLTSNKEGVIEKTAERYREAYKRLTGEYMDRLKEDNRFGARA